MATMTLTRTEPQTQTQTRTTHEERAQDDRSLASDTVGTTVEEHDGANAYLDRIPQTEAIQFSNPRTIKQLLRLRPTATRSEAPGGSTYVPPQSSLSEPVNILVLELGDIVTQRRLRSVDALRRYLRENSHPARRVYLVSYESLTDTVVGQLGMRLELNPDLFALHFTQHDLPLKLEIPSSVAARQIVRFDYFRIDNMMVLRKERISFSVSQRSQESWTGLFLLHDYELRHDTANLLCSNLRETVDGRIHTLFDVILPSMEYSTYIDENASNTLAAFIYSVFPLIISELAGILSAFASFANLAKTTIQELSHGNLSDETYQEKLDWLQKALDKEYIRSRSSYEVFSEVLSSMQRAIDDCDVLRSRLSGDEKVDTQLIRNDLAFLIEHAQRLQRDNEVLLVTRESLLAVGSPNNAPENPLREQSGNGPSQRSGPPQGTITPAMPALSDSSGPFPSPGGGGAPSGPSNPNGPNRRFNRHMMTKIDQIAYMTNLLFSLSFITSVYGMNLKNFTNGGQVQLSQYLATALPFTFVVFIITFVLPGLVARILPGRNRNVELEFK